MGRYAPRGTEWPEAIKSMFYRRRINYAPYDLSESAIIATLTHLDEREKRVLELWWGIGTRNLPLEAIGRCIGKSRERTQIIKQAAERRIIARIQHEHRPPLQDHEQS